MSYPLAEKVPLRVWLVELFATGNLFFLALDIVLAHSANHFAHPAEWIPVIFSATMPFLLLSGLIRRRCRTGFSRTAGLVVGGSAILLGIAGLLLHLGSDFFRDQTLRSLVYAAPFATPLSYTGVGFLLVLNRLEPDDSPDWGQWVIFLALGGFVGNLVLSLCDHAQNGFFVMTEWIPVFAAAFGVSFLLTALLHRTDRFFLKTCLGLLGLQVVVGLLGFGLHIAADLRGPSESLKANLTYGAPIFAPLLFPNLAILAAIGIWDMLANE